MKKLSAEYDYIIVGSGFGGSVSALRLTEKGYNVLVIEAGKRFQDRDFPKTTWDLKKFLWAPMIRCFGIMRMSVFKHVFILSGSGVGGGSLVYANTLLVPKDIVWDDPKWKKINDWKNVMPEFYTLAKKMLGVTKNPYLGPADLLLQKASRETGYEDTFYSTDVGIYFGKPGIETEDPFFNGDGPKRSGCTLCGGCMVGCSHNAKNTLVKNYLYLAEKMGATILPEHEVTDVRPLIDGPGYQVTFQSTTKIFSTKKTITSKGVIFSAGVLGTVKLLLELKEKKSLPNISNTLGDIIRTNSESIIGVRVEDKNLEMDRGIAIGSGIHIDEHTHIEAVRYPKKSDALSLICTILPVDRHHFPRVISWFIDLIKHPFKNIRALYPLGWAKNTIILLVMQTLDGSIKFKLRRSYLNPFKKALSSENHSGTKISSFIPKANLFAHHLAKFTEKGTPLTSVTEIFLDVPTTAHILGGAIMGSNENEGVINFKNEIFNYANLYVCDGSMVSANLGVNPSLTITALTEHAMSYIPHKN
jgi:cholesterol oxidase